MTDQNWPLTFSIDDVDFEVVSDLSEHQFAEQGQRVANERGRAVYAVERFNRTKPVRFVPAAWRK